MVTEITGVPVANASLLDEGTAAAEAMNMCFSVHGEKRKTIFVSSKVYPHTISVIETRAKPLGIKVEIGDPNSVDFKTRTDLMGVILQNPDVHGTIVDWENKVKDIHHSEGLVVLIQDLLSATLHKTPGEMGADITLGSTQRFGVPMGFGGPHAAFFATVDKHRFKMPGRVIGVSKDAHGSLAYRMSMQSRE